MEFTLQSLLLFLRNLVSFLRKRWDRSTRGLLYLLALFRLRSSSRHPAGKRNKTCRNIESRSAKPGSTAVICASRLPPPLTPIAGGDSPVIASPSPISIQVRQPTILNHGDNLEESNENDTDRLDVDGYFLGGSRPISRTPGFTGYSDEPDPIHVVLPLNQEDSTSSSPVIPSRPNSRLSSRYSLRPASQYRGCHPGYWPESQYSHRPPSERSYHSPPSLNGAESAARGYLSERPSPRPSSPALSARAPSFAGSVASRVYRASRPTTRVRRPSPMTNVPRREYRSPTPVSVRRGAHETYPDVPIQGPPLPESRTIGAVHCDRSSVAVTFGPSLSPPPKGKLRPMIGIDRYEKHNMVTVENVVKTHVCAPVTTQFLR
jgi:hypothetical protein